MNTIRSISKTLFLSYSTIIFSPKPWVGAILLAASLWDFSLGLAGLTGTLIALGVCKIAGFDRAATADGRLLFNATLSSLALAFWLRSGVVPPLTFALMLAVVSVAAVGATIMLNHVTLQLCGNASLSLPFCLTATATHWFIAQQGSAFAGAAFVDPNVSLIPAAADLWLHAAGDILFSGSAVTGLIITAGLAVASRISLLNGLIGFGVVSLTLWVFDYPLSDSSWIQINGILCAITMGGISFLPSRGTALLAAISAVLCTALSLSLLYWLRLLDVPMLTLPFNLTALAIISTMRWREFGREPRAVLAPAGSPEETFRLDLLFQARHSESGIPNITPPFDSEWVVTQGFDGRETHRGAWGHAMDFEVADSTGSADRPASHQLEDFPSFDSPVIAPADGRVVRVVDDVADNAIGETNLAENWGNTVVIEISAHLFVQLSHFRRKGIKVREGDRVRQGQLLGYLGNSGRSPLPHLHLQMQTSPEIGAPTIPFRLRHYRTREASGWKYKFSGLPPELTTLSGVRRARWMEDLCAASGETVRVFQIFSEKGNRQEHIRHSLDAAGAHCFFSEEEKSCLRLAVAEGVLHPLTYQGSRDSLLSLIWLAGRIPLVALPGLEWTESVDATARWSPTEHFLLGWIMPYLRLPQAKVRGRMASCAAREEEFVVRWSFSHGASLEIRFSKSGIEGGRCEMATKWMRFHATGDGAIPAHQEAPTLIAIA